MSILTYTHYNDKSFAVRGDKTQYQNIIKQLGGRWNSKMRGGVGWLVPIDKEPQLKSLIEEISVTNNKQIQALEEFKNHSKSRKEQEKYHRAVSENGSDSEHGSVNSFFEEENKVIEDTNIKKNYESEDICENKSIEQFQNTYDNPELQKDTIENKQYRNEKNNINHKEYKHHKEQDHRQTEKKYKIHDEKHNKHGEHKYREHKKIDKKYHEDKHKKDKRDTRNTKNDKKESSDKRAKDYTNRDILRYYESFSKNKGLIPSEKIDDDIKSTSSSNNYESSSDDFPSPGQPCRQKEDIYKLMDKIKDLEKELKRTKKMTSDINNKYR